MNINRNKLKADITSGIRKAEMLATTIDNSVDMLKHELAVLHENLDTARKVLNEELPDGPVVYGGQPKEDPNPPKEPE